MQLIEQWVDENNTNIVISEESRLHTYILQNEQTGFSKMFNHFGEAMDFYNYEYDEDMMDDED